MYHYDYIICAICMSACGMSVYLASYGCLQASLDLCALVELRTGIGSRQEAANSRCDAD